MFVEEGRGADDLAGGDLGVGGRLRFRGQLCFGDVDSQVDEATPVEDITAGIVQDHQVMRFQEVVFFQPFQVEPSEVGGVLFVKFDDVDHGQVF